MLAFHRKVVSGHVCHSLCLTFMLSFAFLMREPRRGLLQQFKNSRETLQIMQFIISFLPYFFASLVPLVSSDEQKMAPKQHQLTARRLSAKQNDNQQNYCS